MTVEPEGVAGVRRIGAYLLLAAAILASAWLRVHAARETVLQPALQGDSIGYVSMAYNLNRYGTISTDRTWTQAAPAPPRPSALTPPGYPMLIAPLMDEAPDEPFLRRALWLQAVLGVLIVVAGFLMARTVLPRWAAATVAVLLALSPQLVTLGTSLLTEVPFALCVTVFGATLARAALREDWRWYAVAGLMLGACALIRPTLQFLPLLLVPGVLWLATRDRGKACAALLAGYLLVFGPWLVRNQVVVGALSDTTTMASSLLHGSYPDFMYEGDPQSRGYPYRFDPEAAGIRRPGQALARIGANFSGDPLGTARWYLLSKPAHLLDWGFVEAGGSIFLNRVSASPYLSRPGFAASELAMHALHLPLMLLSVAGIGLALLRVSRRERDPGSRARGLLAITLLFVVLLHTATLPLARYFVPFRAWTYLFALDAVLVFWAWQRARRAARA